jgi:tetraacyldisaccharide 4'-kinase
MPQTRFCKKPNLFGGIGEFWGLQFSESRWHNGGARKNQHALPRNAQPVRHEVLVSTPFQWIVAARQRLYESGVFKTRRLNHPVISVGNLTMGGTGKTPLVIALAGRLQQEGFQPVVLSRGYGRSSSGVVIVSRGVGPTVSCAAAGDEPYLIARRVPGVSVVVAGDRYQAGTLAEQDRLGNLFILDDGFQHRRLYRNVDIVTIDAEEWAAGERLLPFGVWREPKSALTRAHAACVQSRRGAGEGLDLPIPAFVVRTVVDGLFDGDRLVEPQSITEPVIAFAGIAKPDRFFAALETLKVTISKRIQFPDHHTYSPTDFGRLDGGCRITTEKDAMRLEGSGIGPFLHLRISAKIEGIDDLLKLIRDNLS